MASSMRNYSDASRLPDLHDYIRFDDYEDTVKMWSLVSNICYTMQGGVQSNCFTQIKSSSY